MIDISGLKGMVSVIVLACVLVLVAMAIDLASGLYKAKVRGEIRSSWGLKRTLTKFITYEGSMLIAGGIDVLLHVSRALRLFGLDLIYGVPMVTCALAIFLLIVEGVSVRESADKKTRGEMEKAEKAIGSLISKEELVSAVADAISKGLGKK